MNYRSPSYKFPNWLQVIAVSLPVFLYFFIVNKFAVNIPAQDDYDAILNFLVLFKNAHGTNKVLLLFAQHGEHRILSSRLLYVIYNSVTGTVNFRHIIFLGSLQLLGVFFILVHFIKTAISRYWFPVALVASLCLFDLTNWENAGMAMASVQNYGVVFLFVLSLLLYSKQRSIALAGALLVQIICTFSSGNGMVAAAFLVLYNIVGKDRLRAVVSGGALLVFAPLYFWGYHKPAATQALAAPGTMARYFFHFISNHIYYDTPWQSLLAGVAIFGGLVLLLVANRKYIFSEALRPFVCIAGFVLASIVLTSVFRSSQGYYIPSRYLIYPHLLMAIVFVLLVWRLQYTKAVLPVSLAFGILLSIAYNMNFRSGRQAFVQFNAALINADYYYPRPDEAKRIAERSCEAGIYCIEKERSKIK